MMLFRVQAVYEKLNISQMYTEFLGPDCKLASVAETQSVGCGKAAGRCRSGTQGDSGPVFSPLETVFNAI